jgi:hypothetical protein
VSDSSKAGLPHLNRVRVVAGDCEITITWAERERLLQHVERDIADRFQAVGASRPVELNEEQRAKLLVLHGMDELCDGLRQLRTPLAGD